MECTKKIVESIRAVGVYVTDLDRAVEFYKTILGFDLITKIPPTIAMMKSGIVNLYLESGYDPNHDQKDKTRVSVVFEIAIPSQNAYDMLKNNGVTILQDKPEQLDNDVWWFQFCDPDGNIIELTSKKLEE